VKILLVSMPDTASCFDRVMKMPNLGLCSVAGSLPADVEVKIIDLTLQNQRIGRTLEKLIREYEPDLIGLSAMSFQFQTAMELAKIIRRIAPLTRIAAGGYHATLLYREIAESADAPLLDFIVRAEGEPVLRDLVNLLKQGEEDFSGVPGLSFRKKDGEWIHNVDAPLVDVRKLPLPNR
jgi:radical SAM superfamily enzyme YgiQ (UPF0313 family)